MLRFGKPIVHAWTDSAGDGHYFLAPEASPIAVDLQEAHEHRAAQEDDVIMMTVNIPIRL
jgi:hypothetical protein